MRIRIPYLHTSPMQDLKITLALTPLWWVLGLYFVIYHFAAFLGMTKLLLSHAGKGMRIHVPSRSRWLLVFLAVYLLSLLLNAPLNSAQRTFASVNNYLVYLSGFFVILIIYNAAERQDVLDLMKIGSRLAVLGGIIVLGSLALWYLGYQRLSFSSLVSRLMPFLNDYPYFNVLLKVTLTDTDWFLNRGMPRIPVFTSVMTASGGQVLALLPMLATASMINRGWSVRQSLLLLLPMSIAVLSLARTPLLALIIVCAIMLLRGLQGRGWLLFLLMTFLIAVPTIAIFWSFFAGTAEAIVGARIASTRTRIALYQDAIKYALDHNPVYGIGIKVREGYTTRALGSHSSVIAFFITTGMMGVMSYVLFQMDLIRSWWARRRAFSGDDRTIWTNSGAAFIGFSLWMLTDTLDAVPYISTLYFLIAGILLSWEKILSTGGTVQA